MNNEKNHAARYFLFYHIGCFSLLVAIWWVGMAAQQHRNALNLTVPIDNPQLMLINKINQQSVWGLYTMVHKHPILTGSVYLRKAQTLDSLLTQLPRQITTVDKVDFQSVSDCFFSRLIDLNWRENPESLTHEINEMIAPSKATKTAAALVNEADNELYNKTFLLSASLASAHCYSYLYQQMNWFTSDMLDHFEPAVFTRGYGNAGEHFWVDLFVPIYHDYHLTENLMVNHKLLTPTIDGGVLDTIIPQAGKYRLPVVLATTWGSVLKTDTVTLEVFEQ